MNQAGEPAIGILIIPLALIAWAAFMLVRGDVRRGGSGWAFVWIGVALLGLLIFGVSWSFVGYLSLEAPRAAVPADVERPRGSASKKSSSTNKKSPTPNAARSPLPPEPDDAPPTSSVADANQPHKLSVPPLDLEENPAATAGTNSRRPGAPSPSELPLAPFFPLVTNGPADAANKPRPAWVDSPGEVRPDGTVVVTIKSPRTRDIHHALSSLASVRQNVAQQQIALAWNRNGQRASVHRLYSWLPYSIDQIGLWAQTGTHQEWDDARNVAIYARLEFSPPWEAKVVQLAHQVVVDQRMFFAAVMGMFAIGLLGIGYGYLRLNAATAGAIRWRLRLAAVASATVLAILFAIVIDVTRLDDRVLFPWL